MNFASMHFQKRKIHKFKIYTGTKLGELELTDAQKCITDKTLW